MSTEKGRIRASTGNGGSGRVPEMYDGIRASIGEGTIRVSTRKGRIRASTGNRGSGRVPEMWDPGEYREGKILVSTRKGRIRASTGKIEIWASSKKVKSG